MTAEQWPPPADDATVWSTVLVRRPWEDPLRVKVRTVRLWGQDVRINEAGEVWCHFCLTFRTVEQLGHPDNSCPVGIIWPSGRLRTLREEDMAAEDVAYMSSWLDPLRGSW